MNEQVYQGIYYDGQTAARKAVLLMLTETQLVIRDEDSHWLYDWDYEGLGLASVPDPHQSVLLTHQSHEGERIKVQEPSFLNALQKLSPRLMQDSGFGRDMIPVIGVCMSMALAVFALYWGFNQLVEPLAGHLPRAWEQKLADSAHQQLAHGARLCQSIAGQKALDGMIARLQKNNIDFPQVTVVVVDLPLVNAFALPGGMIMIMQGLVDKAESGDEVAGVLAHEIGHIIHHHPAKRLVREMGGSLFLQLLSGAGSVTVPLINLSYSRQYEAEADADAIKMMKGAGISFKGLEAFFARMTKLQGQSLQVGTLLSDHPATEERLARIKASEDDTPTDPVLTEDEWQGLRKICQ